MDTTSLADRRFIVCVVDPLDGSDRAYRFSWRDDAEQFASVMRRLGEVVKMIDVLDLQGG